MELKIFPKKDESIILINTSKNTNITHNSLENTSQPVVSTELNKLKDDCRPTSHNVESKAVPSKSSYARPSELKATQPKSFLTRSSEPSRNKKIFEKSSEKRNKAMVACPFLKRASLGYRHNYLGVSMNRSNLLFGSKLFVKDIVTGNC